MKILWRDRRIERLGREEVERDGYAQIFTVIKKRINSNYLLKFKSCFLEYLALEDQTLN